eukprot:TRINITY_DN657_c0_g1_i1.p1 TRINITY_DN657_c0_g1~~TRINITY_DN657_c0_g1_i1.p1  ORF type:complete len:274 (+),score=32.83 TRINITY_DN657_c0_g1_i1:42-863(+)
MTEDYKSKLTEVLDVLKEFRTLSTQEKLDDKDKVKCKQLLLKLKLAITKFQLVPPFTNDAVVVKGQLGLARDVLEFAALFSIRDRDVTAFERHVVQLKTYYNDYASILPESDRRWSILGLYLLCLLVLNRLSDFHTELELIPQSQQIKNTYIRFPIQLEEYLMEGSYSKVFAARDKSPSPAYSYFVEQLVDTVRDKIAECSETAYESYPTDDAQKILMFADQDELNEYCLRRGWEIKDKTVIFNRPKEHQLELRSLPLIEQTLGYATELERIV